MSAKAYIKQRIVDLQSKLITARDMYSRTKDEGWAGRVSELNGRLEELKIILNKIERDEQR